MGLTGRGTDCLAMSSQEEPQLKYSYRFRVEARNLSEDDDPESKAEVQSYIKELLGVKDRPRIKDSFGSV